MGFASIYRQRRIIIPFSIQFPQKIERNSSFAYPKFKFIIKNFKNSVIAYIVSKQHDAVN